MKEDKSTNLSKTEKVSKKVVDIVALVTENPITKLTGSYESNIVNKIKKSFVGSEQQMFLTSFYCYLQYHPTKDFVIDLDNIWKWLEFSRKEHAKVVLVKNFSENEDYVITFNFPEYSVKKSDETRGRKKEHLLMNVETFKNLCMIAGTSKAKDIRKYFVKLEGIVHETIDEQSSELRDQLLEQEKVIEEQNGKLSKIDEEKENYLYIGHNPTIKELYKIGITTQILLRKENHKSSNPDFVYLFTYKSDNASKIEDMIKLLLKTYKRKKPEWFNITYDIFKDTVDFAIMMYDFYNIHESTKKLSTFIVRYNKNRLVNSNVARQYFTKDQYRKFIKENFVYGKGKKTILQLIIPEFEEWIDKNNIPSSKPLYTDIGNLSTAFVKDIIENISEITEIDKEILSICDKSKGHYFSKCAGWNGFELKNNGPFKFYTDNIYEKYIKKVVTVTDNNRDKITGKDFMTNFVNWCKQNKQTCQREENVYAKNKFSNLFQIEFRNMIKKFTGQEYRARNTYKGISGVFWNLKIKGAPQTIGNNSGNISQRKKGNKKLVYRFDKDIKLVKTYNTINESVEDEHFSSATLKKSIENKTLLRDSYWSFTTQPKESRVL
jgi:phage anti-repressor protein